MGNSWVVVLVDALLRRLVLPLSLLSCKAITCTYKVAIIARIMGEKG